MAGIPRRDSSLITLPVPSLPMHRNTDLPLVGESVAPEVPATAVATAS